MPHALCGAGLEAALSQPRPQGSQAAPPARLTGRQRQIVEKLIAAHGSDTRAMMIDKRLNKMQHSEGVLKSMMASHAFWKEGSGVDFRVPTKSNRML